MQKGATVFFFLVFFLEKFTFFAVLENSDREISSDVDVMVKESVAEKLELIPDKTKFVTSRSEWSRIDQLPEILHASFSTSSGDFFTSLSEILNKRWQTLDLLSVVEEVKRDVTRKEFSGRYVHLHLQDWHLPKLVKIKDNLSSVPRFQKKEEQDYTA